ncbi:MAG: ATPase [Lentimicrobiaceae bacterium]|nr:ATPase [Lentimicrobiaceae bacterium]
MLVIADSGATKTDWSILQDGKIINQLQTIGFNPFFVQSSDIKYSLEKELYPFFDNTAVSSVYFYGAGCSTENKGNIVFNALEDFFSNAQINIYHDLLGAARALCGTSPGIACILGTGSNSCFYDGKVITENVTSLGYLFGDDGSGAQIGKRMIESFLKETMPDDIAEVFKNTYQITLENILDSVYKKPFPNRYLASFARFACNHINNTYINVLVRNCFSDFFSVQLTKYNGYKEYPANFTGSIAFYFSDILKEVAQTFGIQTGIITQNPMEGLIKYHTALT